MKGILYNVLEQCTCQTRNNSSYNGLLLLGVFGRVCTRTVEMVGQGTSPTMAAATAIVYVAADTAREELSTPVPPGGSSHFYEPVGPSRPSIGLPG